MMEGARGLSTVSPLVSGICEVNGAPFGVRLVTLEWQAYAGI